MSNAATPSYLEIIDFIAAGSTPEAVVKFHPSYSVQRRVAELVERSNQGTISSSRMTSSNLLYQEGFAGTGTSLC
jgi:hypothetical protein